MVFGVTIPFDARESVVHMLIVRRMSVFNSSVTHRRIYWGQFYGYEQ